MPHRLTLAASLLLVLIVCGEAPARVSSSDAPGVLPGA